MSMSEEDLHLETVTEIPNSIFSSILWSAIYAALMVAFYVLLVQANLITDKWLYMAG